MFKHFFHVDRIKTIRWEIDFWEKKKPALISRAECDTRSILKWDATGLNSAFFFSKTSCRTKVKEPHFFLPIADR